jgi:hypothetical protein
MAELEEKPNSCSVYSGYRVYTSRLDCILVSQGDGFTLLHITPFVKNIYGVLDTLLARIVHHSDSLMVIFGRYEEYLGVNSLYSICYFS